MSDDPAVEAAQRAWDEQNVSGMKKPWSQLTTDNTFVRLQIASAREMAKPIRELHQQLCAAALDEDADVEQGMRAVLDALAPLIYTTEELFR